MRRPLLLLPLLAVFLFFPATVAGRAAYVLQINMYGDNVVPPVETESYGFVRFFFNEDRSEADYTLDVKGYSNSAVTGVTINQGAPGENGPVLMTLSEGDFIVTSGHLTLTPEQLAQFTSGNWYLSLTTVYNPEGEIRGQIVVPADFYTGVGGSWYPAPADAPTQPPVVEVTPPPNTGVPVGAPSGGETGGGAGLIQPPNTGDAGLK